MGWVEVRGKGNLDYSVGFLKLPSKAFKLVVQAGRSLESSVENFLHIE